MSQVSAELPRGAAARTYDVRGGPLAAVVLPAAEPLGTVLLVPGFSGSKEDFGPLLPLLAGFTCVALDQRGQHESPGPSDPAAYTVAELAADLLCVVEQLDGPVHLVGHSFGGLVARSAVLQRPDALASLVLLGSGPAGLTGPRVDVLALLPEVIARGGMRAVADAAAALSAADPRGRVPEQVRAFLHARWLGTSPVGIVAIGEALRSEPDRVDELRATGVPVLVLHGDGDDAWAPSLQAEMAARLGAAYVVVPGAQHSPAVEAPEPTADALLSFWSALR